jgi:RNA polymerase sigma-70 factor (ECF subfamily)
MLSAATLVNLFPGRAGRVLRNRAAVRVAEPHAMDDAQIIRQYLVTRDDALFAQLIEKYQQRVFRLAMSILGPGRDADGEDVAQATFVRVFQQLPRFRGESRVSTWLYRIAYNCAIDEKNRITRARERDGGEEEVFDVAAPSAHSPYQQASAAQRGAYLHTAIAELPEMYQVTLRLHYWLGCSVEETAEMLGTTTGTVKSYLFRARARLHEQLAEQGVTS